MRRSFGLLAALVLAGSASAADSPIRSVEVTQDSDKYVANVVMFAPVQLRTAWAVLTDFDNMERWVPNVKQSKVVATEGNMVTVEQQGVARFGIASFPYTSVRQMTLDPEKTVRAKQIKGSMRQLESMMTLTAEGSGTRLDYHLEMVPSGLAAAVLSRDFVKHEMTEHFTAIVEEMVKRQK
jgi:carbon monoxide dehydrogenase subunit G